MSRANAWALPGAVLSVAGFGGSTLKDETGIIQPETPKSLAAALPRS